MAPNAERDEESAEDESVGARIVSVIGTVGRLLPGVIRRHYLLKFGLALLVVVAAISLVGVNANSATTRTLDEQIAGQLESDADRTAQNVGDWQEQRSLWVTRLSKSHTGQTTDPRSVIAMDSKLSEDETHPADTEIVYQINLSTTEVLASSTSESGDRLSRGDGTWAKTDLQQRLESDDDVLVSEVYRHSSGDNVIAFVTKIPQTSDAGLVALVRSQDAFTQVAPEQGRFTTVVNAESGSVAMANRLNKNGTQTGDRMVGLPYSDDSAIETITEAGQATYLGSAPNQVQLDERYVAASAPVENTDFVVVTHAPEGEAFAVRDEIVRQLLLLIGVSLVGLTLIGVLIGGTTVLSLNRLTSRARALEEGNLDIELSSKREDEIGRLYTSFDSMREALRERITEAEDALETAEMARSDAEGAQKDAEQARQQAQEMNAHLEQKAAEYQRVMEACAEGDFTRRLNPDSDSEAMTEIAEAFNEMLVDIERTVATVGEFANDVAYAGSDLSVSSDELEQTSDTVSSSIEQIAGYASDQNDRIRKVSQEIQPMSAQIEEIASTADTVAETSETAADLADDGIGAAQAVVTEMESIEAQADQTLGEIEKLDASMAEISEVVDVITEIADQTNMLALNASIEAARAGTGEGADGSGFRVVASEVKQLAEETKVSAEEITELIENVQSQTDQTVTEMEDMQNSVVEGAKTVEQSVDAFEEIGKQVRKADDGVQDIDQATDEIANSTQELTAMADQVSEASTETADEAGNAAAVTEEQTATITQVSQNANELYDQSQTLQELLDGFTTESQSLDDTEILDEQSGLETMAESASESTLDGDRSEFDTSDTAESDSTVTDEAERENLADESDGENPADQSAAKADDN